MFDGNGNWTSDFSAQADRDNGIKILASRFDNIFIADIKESFENCLTKDGQIAPIGNFNMGGQRITNLNAGVNDNDAVNMSQFNNAVHKTGDETVSGSKTFTNSMTTDDIHPKGNITLGTSTNTWGKQLQFRDTTGKRIARIQPVAIDTTNNRVGMWVNNADNTVEKGIYVGSDGTTSAPASDVNNSILTTVAKSKGNNGYFKLGNGLIIQWGSTENTTTITFPIPFTGNNTYQILLNNQATTDGYGRPDLLGEKKSTYATYSGGDSRYIRWLAYGY